MRHVNIRQGPFGAALASALAPTTSMASAAEWRGWNIHLEDYPVSDDMEGFMTESADTIGGEVTGKVYHDVVMGRQSDAIEQIRLGVIDLGVSRLERMPQSIPETHVVSLPFIIKSISQVYD